MSEKLSARKARAIALAAQGFATPRPTIADSRALGRLCWRLGALQIDSVNVLIRTHYLPAFSRLGPYPREALEALAWGSRKSLFEYWGHQASLLPVELQPLLRWRMERARSGEGTWSGLARFGRERRDYIDEVLRRIEREGPTTGGDLSEEPRQSGWWSWSNGKRALEWLFWAGFVSVRTRRSFERVYDLTERVLPRGILAAATPSEEEAHRALVRIAAQAMGVATAGDLKDYFHQPPEDLHAAIAALSDAGDLIPVEVEGWGRRAYLWPGARSPRRLEASALLSPFDNLIWTRERTQRLFGARVRLEIYTPAHKREHGYYVLPFLLGDRIAARVDLKSDRKAGALKVQAAHLEAGARADATAPALAAELARMAEWLGLARIETMKKGGLSAALSKQF